MIKDLRIKELTNCLKNSFDKVWSFPYTKIKQPSYHALPSFDDETPNRIESVLELCGISKYLIHKDVMAF